MAEEEVGCLMGRCMPALFSGDIRIEPLSTVIRYAADEVLRFKSWGLMVVALPLLLVFGLTKRKRSWNRMALLVGLAGLVALLIPLVMFYAAGYTPGYSVGFLGDSFDRAMMPGAIAIFWSAVALGMSHKTIDRSVST